MYSLHHFTISNSILLILEFRPKCLFNEQKGSDTAKHLYPGVVEFIAEKIRIQKCNHLRYLVIFTHC